MIQQEDQKLGYLFNTGKMQTEDIEYIHNTLDEHMHKNFVDLKTYVMDSIKKGLQQYAKIDYKLFADSCENIRKYTGLTHAFDHEYDRVYIIDVGTYKLVTALRTRKVKGEISDDSLTIYIIKPLEDRLCAFAFSFEKMYTYKIPAVLHARVFTISAQDLRDLNPMTGKYDHLVPFKMLTLLQEDYSNPSQHQEIMKDMITQAITNEKITPEVLEHCKKLYESFDNSLPNMTLEQLMEYHGFQK